MKYSPASQLTRKLERAVSPLQINLPQKYSTRALEPAPVVR
jgi:hypothetical protein